jgi:hypothetical protein
MTGGLSRITPHASGQRTANRVKEQHSPELVAPLRALLRGRDLSHVLTQRRTAACWIYLGIVLLLFLVYVTWLRPANLFGYFHDDTLYFSSARALAAGQGYIIPSLPGTPPQTKYPILYSWLLSWIWKCFPHFPDNVVPAIRLTAFFGCWFLVAAFQFLRRIDGIGDWAALAIVAIIAFEPDFLLLNGELLSDVPFMALALTAIVLADSALSPTSRWWVAALTGCVAGLSAEMRTIGIATSVGILFTALCRRQYRRGLIVFLTAAPFVAVAIWPVLSSVNTVSHGNGADSVGPAWNQTWLYYTSYGGSWKASVPNAAVFLRLLKSTGLLLSVGPVRYLLAPSFEPWSPGGMAVYTILTLALIAGIVRLVRSQGWKPVHSVLLVYSAILLAWPYPQMGRFLLLFLPLFFAGLYVETNRFVHGVVKSLKSNMPAPEKLLAVGLSAILTATGAGALWNYALGGRTDLRAQTERRGSILQEKKQAYEWLRQHTKTSARIVAYEDVLLYLYTGRQAVRPIAFSSRRAYSDESSVLQFDLDHITDVATYVRADFWVMADDDFSVEGSVPLIQARMAQIKSILPLVFSSEEGRVQIYDFSKLLTPSIGLSGKIPLMPVQPALQSAEMNSH